MSKAEGKKVLNLKAALPSRASLPVSSENTVLHLDQLLKPDGTHEEGASASDAKPRSTKQLNEEPGSDEEVVVISTPQKSQGLASGLVLDLPPSADTEIDFNELTEVIAPSFSKSESADGRTEASSNQRQSQRIRVRRQGNWADIHEDELCMRTRLSPGPSNECENAVNAVNAAFAPNVNSEVSWLPTHRFRIEALFEFASTQSLHSRPETVHEIDGASEASSVSRIWRRRGAEAESNGNEKPGFQPALQSTAEQRTAAHLAPQDSKALVTSPDQTQALAVTDTGASSSWRPSLPFPTLRSQRSSERSSEHSSGTFQIPASPERAVRGGTGHQIWRSAVQKPASERMPLSKREPPTGSKQRKWTSGRQTKDLGKTGGDRAPPPAG